MKKVLIAILGWVFLVFFVGAMGGGLFAARYLAERHLPQIEYQKARLMT